VDFVEVLHQEIRIKNIIQTMLVRHRILYQSCSIRYSCGIFIISVKFLPFQKKKKVLKKKLRELLEKKVSVVIKIVAKVNKVLVSFENLKVLVRRVLPFIKKKSLKKILNPLRKNKYDYKTQLQLLILLLFLKNCATLISQYVMFMLKVFFFDQNNFLRFLNVLVSSLNSKLFNKVLGLKIIIKGKLNGNERKKKRILKSKNTPLQTIKNVIDYSFKRATTKYGVFGIKV
jgi:hypothetical protein